MLFQNIYDKSRVFITGHTGFKGSWLTAWLSRLGAEICGFSDQRYTEPCHYALLNPNIRRDECGDIRDSDWLVDVVGNFAPDIVFHLAAQPLVRRSYHDPLETFSTNVLGTANVLQACCQTPSVKAVVVVTTDKVYENREWHWGYRENDPLGGHDPYAASKACTEIVAASFRCSFLEEKNVLLATCRAGNVIGGGDWGGDRLIPDLVRAAIKGKITPIRMPQAVRPWQHVLEPLAGYLLVGQKLLEADKTFADAWNFGPDMESSVSVEEITRLAFKHWKQIRVESLVKSAGKMSCHETAYLTLDSSKARQLLHWKPVWNIEETVAQTIRWYECYYRTGKILTHKQLDLFIENAAKLGIVWNEPQTEELKKAG
ncbi:MAG: CDP-glucose 4,6-dehydratase [Planctomycetaceae bacterium]|jgi:CDP-glucose 4,6-dehydratase|nr:CDP-glucose 4,6-dehydratase [Planctomycetaceae bacterium]